jgi:hypothetical protein
MRVIMLAIIDEAGRKFNPDKLDGISRRDSLPNRHEMVQVRRRAAAIHPRRPLREDLSPEGAPLARGIDPERIAAPRLLVLTPLGQGCRLVPRTPRPGAVRDQRRTGRMRAAAKRAQTVKRPLVL